MGIYIKGMTMPSCCDVCRFSDWSNLHQTACCKMRDYDPCFEDHSMDYREKRADFCPLVEVPEPLAGEWNGQLAAWLKILKSAKFEYDEAWRIITHPTPDVTYADRDRAQVILDTFKDSLGRIDDANNNLHIR